jgi:4-amino-4-deoxy-L-arabinose transferase-like glycosyltransferase
MNRKLLYAIIAGLLLRCLFINSPLVDFFGGMRQTYTAGFTQYLLQNPINLENIFHPHSIVFNNNALELPVYNLFTVFLVKIFSDHEFAYRATSLFFWLLSAIYLAWMSVRIWGKSQAVYIVWTYSLFPLSIFLGHYYHPEILAVFLSIVVIFHFYLYLNEKNPVDLIITLLVLSLTLMVRASQIQLFFIMAILLFSKYKWRTFCQPWAYLILLTLLPYAFWVFDSTDLTSGSRMTQFIGPLWVRFSPIYWGMIVFHRIGGICLSPLGVPLLIAGIASGKNRKDRNLEFAMLYGAFIFFVIVARACFHHPHYQSVLIVPGAIIIGRFLYQMAEGSLKDSWYSWWLAIPGWVKTVLLSVYIFLDFFVLYMFFKSPWDAEKMWSVLSGISIGTLVVGFIISQIILIPLIMFLWNRYRKNEERISKSLPSIIIALIMLTGMVILGPTYKIDTDYIKAGESVAEFTSENGKVVFIGKKDDGDPFVYYSGLTGWVTNTAKFYNDDWSEFDSFVDQGAEYLAVMKSNRYIQPDHQYSEKINRELGKLDVAFEDDYVRIYELPPVR